MSEKNEQGSGQDVRPGIALGEALLSRLQAFGRKPSSSKWWLPRWLSSETLAGLVFLAALSGLSGTMIIFILNAEARVVEERGYSAGLAMLFVLVILVQRYAERTAVARSAAAIEQALDAWRVRISAKVARLSLRDLETLSRGRVQDGLARHYEQLSQTIVLLVSGFESLVLFCFMVVYLFFLSTTAALLSVGIAAVLAVGYMNTARSLKPLMGAGAAADSALSRLSESLVDGVKELRLDEGKRTALQNDLALASGKVGAFRTKAAQLISELISAGRSASYVLAAAIVFILPVITDSGKDDISRIVTAVLFLLGPIGSLIGAAQQLAIAQFCVQSISQFEQQLDGLVLPEQEQSANSREFDSLKFVDVRYAHPGSEDLVLKGLDFQLERGQIVFITGANGSGKTTALRVLAGLYPAEGGRIELNGSPLPTHVPQSYRSLFAAVFADGYVFSKPYGLDTAQLEVLSEMLGYMGLRDKLPANLENGFDPDQLSTGQKKRLALCLAVAEGRPILILDEWAADQDPETRARFYNETLQMLRARGTTIVAITHDDRYFGTADARYHMDEGRMSKVSNT